MGINRLAHYSVRTNDLEASRRFYSDVLGLREGFRPQFRFPGVWMYLGGDEGDYGIVHLIAPGGDSAGLTEYLGDRPVGEGTGLFDHIAFLATDLGAIRARLRSANVRFRERTVPSLGLHQVFFEDPSGVTIELNFPAEEVIAP